MSAPTVADDASAGKRLGAYAVFDCEHRPSSGMRQAAGAMHLYPEPIEQPRRLRPCCLSCDLCGLVAEIEAGP